MAELKNYQMYINGEWVAAQSGKTFESINPSDGKPWAVVPEADEVDVDTAVKAAHRAFTEGPWSTMTATERGKLLRRLGDVLAEHSESLGHCETVDTGKLFKETRWQARYISDYFYYYAGLADKVSGETLPIDKPNMWTMTIREPLGVVAAVVPWNSQLFLVAVKIGPALAAGNTVVLKASEHASAPMLEFAKVFEEAGFPPGVFNVISGLGEPCGRALTSHPLVDRISFTGGPETARHVVRNSAENFAQVSLELGGKSPVVIFDDADLESATNGVLLSIFSASGQSCVAGSRLLLHESIHDEVLARVAEKASKIRIGDPLDENSQMGPLATQAQLDNIDSTVADAKANGATLVHGGKQPAGMGDGWYYEPTVVACPDQQIGIVQRELFGPVVSALRFTDEAHALQLANDCRFGLAAGIFTADIGRALRITKGIRSGIVWVNTYRMVSPLAPFGGYKDSGYGRESGLEAIYDYTRPKTVWLNTSPDPIADPFVMQ
ncbi:MAG: aldehyde dehydrogenase [Pseudomonadota bacterium]|nr:aldehyde dehydrogenase [Pseudomonadota bacterium]MEC8888656.1 aldehyde dehydrogenase [Pseudomonadota bacterium]MEC8963651.1 aldehyde dehydrogenase [Pseudomonadota bacterium]MEC9370424.1 aldehyde dehydrogenase [Pseudomonadota bacterium]MEE3280223.1 aldehyde dehydrogenase [Pseudomonadota bacterium]|tara:strand:+ start:1015 stop:2499 length:1485 start_codon:yes stop_codon:yes gene_type:complete